MNGITLVESATLDAPKIDRRAGVVRDVRVLNPTSKNGRHYTARAMRDLVTLGENATVFIDHADPKHAGTRGLRSVRERFGVLRGLHESNGGVSARELRFDPSHEYADSFIWNAQNSPRHFGLSINAFTSKFRREKGVVVVEAVEAVHSIDLVDNPGATISLFEQTRRVARAATRPIDLVKDELIEVIEGDQTDEIARRAKGKFLARKLFPSAAPKHNAAAVARAKAGLLRTLGRA